MSEYPLKYVFFTSLLQGSYFLVNFLKVDFIFAEEKKSFRRQNWTRIGLKMNQKWDKIGPKSEPELAPKWT